MDAPQDGTAESIRVAEIRREIEATRLRIAETVDALEYKADISSRFGEKLSATASTVSARVRRSMPSSPRRSAAAPGEASSLQGEEGEA